MSAAGAIRIACVQLRAGDELDGNLERAERLCRAAGSRGADIVVLPEKWAAFRRGALEAAAEPIDGPIGRAVAGWARALGVAIIAGSLPERPEGGDGRLANTSVAYDRDGRRVAVYRKIHLFDVDVEGRRVRESDVEAPGDRAVVTTLAGMPTGLTVCYDVRFPELFRLYARAGAELVSVPAAFLERTGRDHWEVLLRARAIENQLFVAAAAQWGEIGPGYVAYGRSLICDPWGVVLAQAPDGDGLAVADASRETLERVRRELPALRHVRPDAYRLEPEQAV
jgi:predicted amidohydrolase